MVSKRKMPMTAQARTYIEQNGGIEKVSGPMLADGLRIPNKQAHQILYQLRTRPDAGKGLRGPHSRTIRTLKNTVVHANRTSSFVQPGSAVAKLLGNTKQEELSETEIAFLSAVAYIGIGRAETLLQEMKVRLTRDIHKL